MNEHDDQSLDMRAPYVQRKPCIGYMMQYIYCTYIDSIICVQRYLLSGGTN